MSRLKQVSQTATPTTESATQAKKKLPAKPKPSPLPPKKSAQSVKTAPPTSDTSAAQPTATQQAPQPAPAAQNGDVTKICAVPGCGRKVTSRHPDAVCCSPECNAKFTKAAYSTSTQRTEQEAQRYCDKLVEHIDNQKGRYLVDEQGGGQVETRPLRAPQPAVQQVRERAGGRCDPAMLQIAAGGGLCGGKRGAFAQSSTFVQASRGERIRP